MYVIIRVEVPPTKGPPFIFLQVTAQENPRFVLRGPMEISSEEHDFSKIDSKMAGKHAGETTADKSWILNS